MSKKIAPKEVIERDYQKLRATERLLTAPKIEEIILMQSLEGRAHNGAGQFNKRFYVNTTIDDIVRALGRNPKTIRNKRQELIDEVRDYVDSVLAEDPRDRLVTRQGRPLLGISVFKSRQVDANEVLKGLYLGGLRDSPELRKKTQARYGITIGYGRCYLINARVMEVMGLDGETLAHQAHEDKIEYFVEEGLIVDEQSARRADAKDLKYMYIRHRVGPGQSDDAAIVASGLLYNVDVALGVFLADAVDTLEKYARYYTDQDEEIARHIESNYPFLGLEEEDVCELAYVAAIPPDRLDEIPDSSLRYLLTLDPETGQSTIETHLNFIEGRPYAPIVISYKRIMASVLYEFVTKQVKGLRKGVLGAVPDLYAEKLEESVVEVMQRRFVTVSPQTSLKTALKKAAGAKSETIVVRDEEGNILGVVNPADFLVFLRGR